MVSEVLPGRVLRPEVDAQVHLIVISSIYTFAVFRAARSVLSFLVVIGALAVLWEVVKLLGGDPSEAWTPPFQWTVASDLNMPHVWDIAASFVEPAQRNGPPLGIVLVNAGFFTFREAFGGFVFGALLGLALAIVFVHSRILERALVPYVVASQTVPIIAIAPVVVIGFFALVRAAEGVFLRGRAAPSDA